MFKKFIPAGKALISKLFNSLKRFPEALPLTAAVVFILIVLHHLDYSTTSKEFRDTLIRISMVLALGVPLLLSLRLFFERMPSVRNLVKISLYIGIITGLVLYYHFWLKNFTMVPLSRYTAFTLAFYLMFLFIPYLFKRENFELYCVQLFTNFAITYFYAIVLYLGLAAMLFTVSKLFAVQMGRIYFDIWLIAAGIFAPAYFLADIPEYKKEFPVAAYPKVLKILFLYIVIPLLTAYSAILYAYFAKIIFTRTWPEGIVSHLVLWYSLISSLVIFFVYPLRADVKWLPKFISIFPKLMLPLLAMMFVAMGIRIQSYGITENRYFVMIAGLWVTGLILYYLFAGKVRNIVLPVSLALVAALSVTGPWSAYSISKLSQSNRFTAILTKYNMIRGEVIVKPEQQLPKSAKTEIVSILSYFQRFHSLAELKYLPRGFKLSQTPELFRFKVKQDDLNFRNRKSYYNYEFPNDQMVKVEGYDYFANIPHLDINKTASGGKIKIIYKLETGDLTILLQGKEVYRRKVADLIIPFLKTETALPKAGLTFEDENSRLKVLYVCSSVSSHQNPVTEELEINYLNFFVFIKLK